MKKIGNMKMYAYISKNEDTMELWKSLGLCFLLDCDFHPTTGYCTGAVSLCAIHDAVVHSNISHENLGRAQSTRLPVSRDKQICHLICHMDFISLNNNMWSLMGDLSVQVDVLICSDVCVAAGNIHFLSFI